MTAPRLLVDTDSPLAPWRQIHDQILRFVLTGDLPVGSALPPIRQVARDLGLAAGTVARAYRELEATGILRTAGRRGTQVVAVPEAPERNDPLAEAARGFVVQVRALDVDAATALAAVQAALHQQSRTFE